MGTVSRQGVATSRATGTLTFPANFMLVAAMNPCPCGYFGDPVKECTCSPTLITRYRPTPLSFGDFPAPEIAGLRLRSQAHLRPLARPQCEASLWDRHPHRSAARGIRPRRGAVRLAKTRGRTGRTIAFGETGGKLTDDRLGEPSANVRGRVEKAREVQRQRFAGAAGGTSGKMTLLCNADTSAPAAQTVSSRRTRGPNGMQVWAQRRCANAAAWTMPARACP